MGRKILPPHPDPKKQKQRERSRAYYWRHIEKTREAAKMKMRKKYATDQSFVEDQRRRKREYGRANAAAMVAKAKAWARSNPEKWKANKRAAYARNPEKWLNASRNYRARLRGATGSHTAKELRDRLEEQCGRCAYCLEPFDPTLKGGGYEVEHVIPIARGGSNDIDNIVLACPSCNNSKNDRTVLEFLQYRERNAA